MIAVACTISYKYNTPDKFKSMLASVLECLDFELEEWELSDTIHATAFCGDAAYDADYLILALRSIIRSSDKIRSNLMDATAVIITQRENLIND